MRFGHLDLAPLEKVRHRNDAESPKWRSANRWQCVSSRVLHHHAWNRDVGYLPLALQICLSCQGGVPSVACLTNPAGECKVCPSAMTKEGEKNFR